MWERVIAGFFDVLARALDLRADERARRIAERRAEAERAHAAAQRAAGVR